MKKRASRFLIRKRLNVVRQKLTTSVPLSIGVLVVAAGLLCYKLLSLVPFGNAENSHAIGSANLSEIKNGILFAPVKGLELAILKVSQDDVYIRLASVATALTAAWLLYLMLRKWHTARVSLLTSLLFVTSSWFLHAGRLASVDVLYLCAVPALLLITMWFLSKRDNTKLPLAGILLGLTLYIPGTWLLILCGVIYLRKQLVSTAKKLTNRTKQITIGCFVVTLAPLIYSMALKPSQFSQWLGINTEQDFTLRAIANNFVDIPQQLFVSGLSDPTRWLVGTPILDVFSVAMLVIGIFAYRAGHYATREKLVTIVTLICVLLIGLGQVATIGLLIPILYIIIANGIAYMLQSWFTVFPRNPVARSLGVVLLTVVIVMSCSYQLQRYFVAWPEADATKPALISGS